MQITHRPSTRFLARIARAFAVVVVITATPVIVGSCDILKQVQGAANMVNCKYNYLSLTGVKVAGINVSQGLSFIDVPRILGLLVGGGASLPISCTVNLDVQNPGTTDAILNSMEYALTIDGIDFTSGSLAQQLSIAPGGSGLLPLTMSFDVAQLLRGESRDAVVGVVRNLAGLGGIDLGSSEPSRVTLNLKPSFNVGDRRITSPVPIPVNFSFGGK